MAVTIFCDGGCRGNPGPSSAGIWVPEFNIRSGYYLGILTNNVAEYSALILSFLRAKDWGWRELTIKSDSKLMVEQMKGVYGVRSEKLLPLYEKALELETYFDSVSYYHVKRAFNVEADLICNEVLDDVAAGKERAIYSFGEVPKNICVGVLTLDNHSKENINV